jgi:hypothetical protein
LLIMRNLGCADIWGERRVDPLNSHDRHRFLVAIAPENRCRSRKRGPTGQPLTGPGGGGRAAAAGDAPGPLARAAAAGDAPGPLARAAADRSGCKTGLIPDRHPLARLCAGVHKRLPCRHESFSLSQPIDDAAGGGLERPLAWSRCDRPSSS